MTAKQTQETYFEANAVDGKLTDAQTMEMMFLPEVDTTVDATQAKPEDSSTSADAATGSDDSTPTPPAATDPAATPAPADPAPTTSTPTPVLLAKDGVHTIPFSELERARAAQQSLTDQLADAQAKLTAFQNAPKAPADAQATLVQNPVTGEYEVDLGDLSEDAIKDGVKKGIAAGVAAHTASLVQEINALKAALAPIQQQQATSEDDAHFGAINRAHPDIESVLPSQEYAKWLGAQPGYVQAAINNVIDGGTAAEVIEVMDRYKTETGLKTTPPVVPPQSGGAVKTATVDPAVKAAAQAAIDSAKSATPNSLSDIPAGATAHHDAAEAVLNMSTQGHMNLFLDKTPEQIEAILAKTL